MVKNTLRLASGLAQCP